MQVQTIYINTLGYRFNRVLLKILFSALFLSAFSIANADSTSKITRPIVVYKSPTCGCCGAWVEHMEQAGFTAKIKHSENLNEVKRQLGVEPMYDACHTMAHKGYVFEGHIPASIIRHFLAKKPDAKGLAVPGMPLGSPGMDNYRTSRPYEVLRLNKDGSSTPYARVSAKGTVYLEESGNE